MNDGVKKGEEKEAAASVAVTHSKISKVALLLFAEKTFELSNSIYETN